MTAAPLLLLLEALLADDRWMWWSAGAFVAAVVGSYLALFLRRSRADAERLEEASRLGFDRPTGQFPYIDPALCIGCGSCVAACPEGDVLGLIGGQAVVVNGIRCVGIGACQAACPVGAIEVGLGEIKGRADLPVLGEDLETNVPGLFIAGELGGLSLVRNAFDQGRRTVLTIAERLAPGAGGPFDHDLIIVGCGPAGLAAALTATELGLDHLVLEQAADLGGTVFNYPRRKLVHTQPVEVPLHGRLEGPEHSKEELLELFSGLVERHGPQISFGSRVEEIRPGGDRGGFEILVEGRQALRSRFVVLGLGRRGTPRKLGVPGESLPKVMYQVRDADQYQGQRILCVGGGDSAVEAAMGLASQPGNVVSVSYRKDRFGRIKRRNQERIERCIAERALEPLFASTVQEIRPDAVRLQTDEGERWIENDYVFIFAGGEPPYGLLRSAGVLFGDDL